MKRFYLLLLSSIAIGVMAQTPPSKTNTKRLIVKFKSGVEIKTLNEDNKFNLRALDQLNQQYQIQEVKLTGNKKKENTYVFSFESDVDMTSLIQTYQNTHLFEYVESDHMGTGGGQRISVATTPTDTYFNRQYSLYNDGTFSAGDAKPGADIDMKLAWDIEQGDQSIIVAVLDTGTRLDHPEFKGRIWQNDNEVINGIDDDNNGYIDDINGWDFANDDSDPSDDYGHGTNVAGIIGANGNNNLGYAGVDWNSQLMIGKILDENNSGFYTWWVEGIYYAVDNGADVINMSVGGDTYSIAMQEAIDYADDNNVVVVACMMNNGRQAKFYPAAYSSTIAVGSTDPDDQRSAPFFWSINSGSNFGNHIDVVAPGNYIYGLTHLSNFNYEYYWGGTSQSTPLVAGLSALLMAQNPDRTPAQIRDIIRTTAEDMVGKSSEDVKGFDIYHGYGRINAHQALLLQSLSTEENLLNTNNIKVYPNPFTDYITINSSIEFDKIVIHDLNGRKLLEESKKELANEKLNLAHLSEGLYILSVMDQNGVVLKSEKLIK